MDEGPGSPAVHPNSGENAARMSSRIELREGDPLDDPRKVSAQGRHKVGALAAGGAVVPSLSVGAHAAEGQVSAADRRHRAVGIGEEPCLGVEAPIGPEIDGHHAVGRAQALDHPMLASERLPCAAGVGEYGQLRAADCAQRGPDHGLHEQEIDVVREDDRMPCGLDVLRQPLEDILSHAASLASPTPTSSRPSTPDSARMLTTLRRRMLLRPGCVGNPVGTRREPFSKKRSEHA